MKTSTGGRRAALSGTSSVPSTLTNAPHATDLDGILTLRKFEDTLALLDALTPGTKLVIVGGGWIGLEVASAAIEADCSVTVLEHFELPLLNVLGADIAGWFARLHRGHGVDLRTGVGVAGFEGSGRVTGVRLDDGEVVPADVVLVGVGAIPNTDLAAAAGLRVDNGVRVDEHLRTDDPHVYAVGDIVLKEVAARMAASMAPIATPAARNGRLRVACQSRSVKWYQDGMPCHGKNAKRSCAMRIQARWSKSRRRPIRAI